LSGDACPPIATATSFGVHVCRTSTFPFRSTDRHGVALHGNHQVAGWDAPEWEERMKTTNDVIHAARSLRSQYGLKPQVRACVCMWSVGC
jgi:hypothetical protein